MTPEGKTTMSKKTQTWSKDVGQEDTIPEPVETFISKGQRMPFCDLKLFFKMLHYSFPKTLHSVKPVLHIPHRF